jgi:hypothetical protein
MAAILIVSLVKKCTDLCTAAVPAGKKNPSPLHGDGLLVFLGVTD